jgi:signal transduction histidine kinase
MQISHEIRNPLSAIIQSADAILLSSDRAIKCTVYLLD